MHRLIFFLILSFSSLCATLEEAPVLFEGRVRPASAVENQDNMLVLPKKKNLSEWVSLENLEKSDYNFTPYSDKAFGQINEAYREKNWKLLDHWLIYSYQDIAGKKVLEGNNKSMTLPSVNQLFIENIYLQIPWFWYEIEFFVLATILLALGWRKTGLVATASGWFFLSLQLLFRIYILERPPVSNMLETLLFVSWLALTSSFIIRGKTLLPANVVAAILLAIAGWMTDRLDNVQAVLNSNYWLTVHVLLVVGSYALFLIAGLLGHAFLLLRSNRELIAKNMRLTIYLGLGMLVSGTLLGGAWAAQSWGRFWDWDPKESWAFITACSYLVFIHAYRYKLIQDYGVAVGAILGMWIVSFTWYGVNYILGTGMHSYGFGSGGVDFYIGALILDACLVGYLVLRHRNQDRLGYKNSNP